MHRKRLQFTAASDQIAGARDYQEDSIRIWCPDEKSSAIETRSTVLAVLCDGMGGHVSGEVASNLVCDHVIENFSSQSVVDHAQLESMLMSANNAIASAVEADQRLSGMGCTVVAALLDSKGLRWASVGDSSLFVFRNNELIRLNENHSLGALLDEQVKANVISEEDARKSPNRQSLRSALTGVPIPLMDIRDVPRKLRPGDWVILASDGLDTLSGDEIADVFAANIEKSPQEIATLLLEEVDRRKAEGQDNASVIVLRIQEGSDAGALLDDTLNDQSDDDASDRDTEIVVAEPAGAVVGRVRPRRTVNRRSGPGQNKRSGISLPSALFLLALVALAAVAAISTFPDSKALIGEVLGPFEEESVERTVDKAKMPGDPKKPAPR